MNRLNCPECGADHDGERALAAHRRKHRRPAVVCPLCRHALKDLERHLERVHPGTEPQSEAVRNLLALLDENKALRARVRQLEMEKES